MEDKLTFAMENYLEAVFELSRGGTGARLTDIALRLDVTKASANNAIASLSRKGLITNEKYQEIFLTPQGLRHARMVAKKHLIIKDYFANVLQIEPDIADVDACAIEHVISPDSVSAMYHALINQGFYAEEKD